MNERICAICAQSEEEVGVLLDDVCAKCNPDSHESEAIDELDKFIRNGAFVFDLSDKALEVWEQLRDEHREKVSN